MSQTAAADNINEERAAIRSILLIEDNPFDTVLIQGQLRKLWPESAIIPAESIEKAREAREGRIFGMILLDLNLPDSQGPATVSRVRGLFRDIPIIVITGAASDMTVHEALKLGANNVVPKAQIMDEDFANILEQNIKC